MESLKFKLKGTKTGFSYRDIKEGSVVQIHDGYYLVDRIGGNGYAYGRQFIDYPFGHETTLFQVKSLEGHFKSGTVKFIRQYDVQN